MPHSLQQGGIMEEYGEDAAMPLECSVFEPRTPFPYAGLIHMPGTDGSSSNKGREGNGADRIEVSHEVVVDEISKGLHPVTGRPISALLNHCIVRKAAPESRAMLAAFYATVRKRKSARRRVRVDEKKRAVPTGTFKVDEESFGIADAPGNGTGPAPAETSAPEAPAVAVAAPKNKGGRPKGSKTKKRGKASPKKAAPATVGATT